MGGAEEVMLCKENGAAAAAAGIGEGGTVCLGGLERGA